MEECHKAGIKTAFGTMWDGGHGGYLNVYGSLLGMQLYAEFIYYEKVNDEHLKEYFELITASCISYIFQHLQYCLKLAILLLQFG